MDQIADAVADDESLAISDVNADGVVDSSDVVVFIDGWLEESAIADMDMNAEFTAEDVVEFQQAYSNGNP